MCKITVHCGFDIFPPLPRSKAAQALYDFFLAEILTAYGPDGKGIAEKCADNDDAYLRLNIAETPTFPRRCDRFLRFSTDGVSFAGLHLRDIQKFAEQFLGDRVYAWHNLDESTQYIRKYGCYTWNEIRGARGRVEKQRQEAQSASGINELIFMSTKGYPFSDTVEDDIDFLGSRLDELGRLFEDSPYAFKPYAVLPVEGKGLGLVAMTKIVRGERILEERPLFKVPVEITSIKLAEETVAREVRDLSREEQRLFFALNNTNRNKYKNPLLGTAVSNMLRISEENSEDHGGLFPEAARLNHSCRPNAQHIWNPNLGRLTVHALTDIDSGVEITISYLSSVSPVWDVRRLYLQECFSFQCNCELCSLPVEERARSDQRLAEIQEIDENLCAGKEETNRMANPIRSYGLVRRRLSLLSEEGVADTRTTRAYLDACLITITVGDKARAIALAERAYHLRKLMSGDDHPATEMFHALALRPVDHPLYAKKMIYYGDNWEPPRDLSADELEEWLWNTDQWTMLDDDDD